MKPHILQTVADLRQERERLDDIIATLERYGAATDPQPVAAPVAVADPEPTSTKAKAPRRGQPPTKEASSILDQVRAAIAKIKSQQFKVSQLCEFAPGLTAEQLGGACAKLRAKKELMKTGFGVYARTDRFSISDTGAPSKTEQEYKQLRESLNVHVPEVELKGQKVRGE